MDLNANTCYLPNAAKLMPLGFEPIGFDSFGRRHYKCHPFHVYVDCADDASGEVVLTKYVDFGGGRLFAGLLPTEGFFDLLLLAIGFTPKAPYKMPPYTSSLSHEQ